MSVTTARDQLIFSQIFGKNPNKSQRRSARRNAVKMLFSNTTSTKIKIKRTQLRLAKTMKEDVMLIKPGNQEATDLTNMPDEDTAVYCGLDDDGDSFKFKTSANNTIVITRTDSGNEERFFITSAGDLSTLFVENPGTSTLTSSNTSGYLVEDAIITIENITLFIGSVTSDGPSDNAPCFLAGSMVQVGMTQKAIENLRSGDLIDGRYEVLKVLKTKGSSKQIVRLQKNCLGQGKPNRDLCITFDHLILDAKSKRMFNARQFVGVVKGVEFLPRQPRTLYHILLKEGKWAFISTNGILSESLLPDVSIGTSKCSIT